jgi:uncharacterized iron-regulated membrane protein
LVCTLFLLVACLTGLPLIFHDELENWLSDAPPYASLPKDAPYAGLDVIAAESLARYPDQIILSVVLDDDEPKTLVFMAPSWAAVYANRKAAHWIKFDARTAAVIKESSGLQDSGSLIAAILQLHKSLLAGDVGKWVLAIVAASFGAATVSGIVVYGPFMRDLKFGTVRTSGSLRLKWLDVHNLLGGVAALWMLVVAMTGLMNELSGSLFDVWRNTEVKEALKKWSGPPIAVSEYYSLQGAVDHAKAAVPGMTIVTVIPPGSIFSTPYHYLVWAKGQQPLTSRLFSPVLVNARTGKVEGILSMPWYLRALEVSRPLHFGDYGGMPLKFIWAAFDLATIVVLASGLYLWMAKGRRRRLALSARRAAAAPYHGIAS